MRIQRFWVGAFALMSIGATALPSIAVSQELDIQIGRSDGYRDGEYYRDRGDDRYGRGGCSPREALRQARARGMRDVQIYSIDRRMVVVDGYGKRNEYTQLGLANVPGCPRGRR